MENLKNFNFANLSDSQLECLIFDASNEKVRRDKEKEKQYWKKVCKAIEEYLDNVGDIIICDSYDEITLDTTDIFDFSEAGVIRISLSNEE